MRKLISIFMLLMLSNLAFAHTDETDVTCPPANLVIEAADAMDDALPDYRDYIVSSKPVIHFENRKWSARTTVRARRQEDAIKLAKVVVREVKSLMTPTAIKVFDKYGCTYFSARAFVYTYTPA